MPSSPESEPGADTASEPEPEVARTGPASDHEELTAELARIEDRYKRALADLDNYRKRSEREIERRVAQARESVLQEWLHVVDSVERAVRLEPPPCAEGMRALLEQMDVVLTHQGVERIGAPGDRFDPERHEAIAVEPSGEVPERTIAAVQQSGYAIGDRVIRPAQVVVARAPEHSR
jgi:molecular chaperone GrpE